MSSDLKVRISSFQFCLLVALLLCAAGGGARARQNDSPRQTRRGGAARAAEDASALLVRALELLRAGRAAEAEPLVRRALAAEPGNADAHALLGLILDQRGRALSLGARA